jgi:hypothetical protein
MDANTSITTTGSATPSLSDIEQQLKAISQLPRRPFVALAESSQPPSPNLPLPPARHSGPKVESRYGICHQIAAASVRELLQHQPQPKPGHDPNETIESIYRIGSAPLPPGKENYHHESMEQRKQQQQHHSWLPEHVTTVSTPYRLNTKGLDDAPTCYTSDDDGGDHQAASGASSISILSTSTYQDSPLVRPAIPAVIRSSADASLVVEAQLNRGTVLRFRKHPLLYYFRKLALSVLNTRLLQLVVTSWRAASHSRQLLKTVTFKFYLSYLRFLLRSVIESLRSSALYRKKMKNLLQHQSHLTLLNAKTRVLKHWRARTTRSLQIKCINKVMRIWGKNSVSGLLRKWKMYSLKVTAWLLVLSLHKWKRAVKQFLRLRGRLRARRTISTKRSTFRALARHWRHSAMVKRHVVSCFAGVHKRFMCDAFKILLCNMKFHRVVALRERNAAETLMYNLRVKYAVSSIRRFFNKRRFFKVWKNASKISITSRWLGEYHKYWTAHSVIQSWREYAIKSVTVRRLGAGVSRRECRDISKAVLSAWRRVTWCTSLVVGRKAARAMRTTIRVVIAWTDFVAARRQKKRMLSVASSAWSARGLSFAFDRLFDNTRCQLRLKRAAEKGRAKLLRLRLTKAFATLSEYSLRRKAQRKSSEIADVHCSRKLAERGLLKIMEHADRRMRIKALVKRALVVYKERRLYCGLKMLNSNVAGALVVKMMGAKRLAVEGVLSKRVLKRAWLRWFKTEQTRDIGRRLQQSLRLKRTDKAWQKWILVGYAMKAENALMERSNRWHRDFQLRAALWKWSVRSLRRVAGYQIADRFKARERLRTWHAWAQRKKQEALLVWVGERSFKRSCLQKALRRFKESVKSKKEERVLWGLWDARRGGWKNGECASTVRACFRSWLEAMKMRVEEVEREKRASSFRVAVMARMAWREWESFVEERRAVRGGLKVWRTRAGSGELFGCGKGIVKWRRRFRMRVALRAFRNGVERGEALRKSIAHYKTAALKRSLLGLRRNVTAVRAGVAEQVERKTRVLRKIKIFVLKKKLADAHRRRALVRSVLRAWAQADEGAEMNARRHCELTLMARCYVMWKLVEKMGRRERWISRLRGVARLETVEEEVSENVAVVNVFSPSLKQKKGYGRGGGGGGRKLV